MPANNGLTILASGDGRRNVTQAANVWICSDDIKLSTSDRDILLSPVGYLNDRIILAAQTLLKRQSLSEGGFQDTLLGQTCNFEVETEEFIQILFNCCNHWLLVMST